MNKMDNPNRDKYLQGDGYQPPVTHSSILVSSSPYLNNAELRELIAQEALRRNGRDLNPLYFLPPLVNEINKVAGYENNLNAILRERELKPEFAAWLDARYFSKYSAEAVAHCAPGTLGAKIHDFIVGSGMNMGFHYNGEPIEDDLQYYLMRTAQSHDIEHMVTGLEPVFFGEAALIYFKAAMEGNYFSPAVAAITHRQILTSNATAFMRCNFHYPHLIPGLIEAMRVGADMASRAKKFFLYIKWEEYYDLPLDALREELGLSGFPVPGAWHWSEEARFG